MAKSSQLKRKTLARGKNAIPSLTDTSESEAEELFFLIEFLIDTRYSVVSERNLSINTDRVTGIYRHRGTKYNVKVLKSGSQEYCNRKADKYGNNQGLETTEAETEVCVNPEKRRITEATSVVAATTSSRISITPRNQNRINGLDASPITPEASVTRRDVYHSPNTPEPQRSLQYLSVNERQPVSFEVSQSAPSQEHQSASSQEHHSAASEERLTNRLREQYEEYLVVMNAKLAEFKTVSRQKREFMCFGVCGSEKDLVTEIPGKNIVRWSLKTADFLFTQEELSKCTLVPSDRTTRAACDPAKVKVFRAAMVEKYSLDDVRADAAWAIVIDRVNNKGRSLRWRIANGLKKLIGTE